jgi:sugar phosphate permease
LAFWVPTYFQQVRGFDAAEAGLYFGGITVLAGVIGTAAGGVLGDRWQKRDQGAYLKISALGMLLAAPALVAGPYVKDANVALACFFAGEVLVFLNTGPLNAALVASAAPRFRELAIGLNILAIHLFGDAASPAIVGAVADALTAHNMANAAARSFSIAATAIPLVLGSVVLWVGARRFQESRP